MLSKNALVHAAELGIIKTLPTFIAIEKKCDTPRTRKIMKNLSDMATAQIKRKGYFNISNAALFKLRRAISEFAATTRIVEKQVPASVILDFFLGMINDSDFHYNKMFEKNILELSKIFSDNEEHEEIFTTANELCNCWEDVKIKNFM